MKKFSKGPSTQGGNANGKGRGHGKSSFGNPGGRSFGAKDKPRNPFERNDGPPREKREGGFNREGGSGGFNREKREGGFNREGGTGFNREKREGSFNREGGTGGFNREKREGGFNREGGTGFNREKREGGFNREGGSSGFNREKREGGFNREGGTGGFNREKREGGEGGFNRERREANERPRVNTFQREGYESNRFFLKKQRLLTELESDGSETVQPENQGTDQPVDKPKYDKPFDKRESGVDKKKGQEFIKREAFERNRRSRDGETSEERPRERKSRSADSPQTPEYDFRKMREMASQSGKDTKESNLIRLNRFIANAGVCSRREADALISKGRIMVNGQTVTELGFKVKPTDEIRHNQDVLKRERKVYVLLNKPKDYLTTTEDPEERKTVMTLVSDACDERIYPVGRLDRNTTGLLILTNDGEMAKRLSHPSHNIKKVYQLELETPFAETDFEKLTTEGITLEDGPIKPDKAYYMTDDRMVLGIELHSGRNRIVRRIFEHFGCKIIRLDRSTIAGITKKGIGRGQWRYLTEQEVIRLKYF